MFRIRIFMFQFIHFDVDRLSYSFMLYRPDEFFNRM